MHRAKSLATTFVWVVLSLPVHTRAREADSESSCSVHLEPFTKEIQHHKRLCPKTFVPEPYNLSPKHVAHCSYLYQIAHLGDDDDEPEFSSAMPLEEGDTFLFQPRALKNLVVVDEMDSLAPIMHTQVRGSCTEESVLNFCAQTTLFLLIRHTKRL